MISAIATHRYRDPMGFDGYFTSVRLGRAGIFKKGKKVQCISREKPTPRHLVSLNSWRSVDVKWSWLPATRDVSDPPYRYLALAERST